MKNNRKSKSLFKIRLKNEMKSKLAPLIGTVINDADLKSVIMYTGLSVMKDKFSNEVIPQFEKKVINGCNGSCCTEFTFPYMPEELRKMIEVQDKNEILNGKFITYPREEMVNIADMLVFIRETDICPQEKRTFKSIMGIEGDVNYTSEEIKEKFRSGDFYKVKDNNIVAKVFTCRHFDKENRVCNNYENRPQMCKSFGSNCKYEGCCFVANREKEIIKEIEDDKIKNADKYLTEELNER